MKINWLFPTLVPRWLPMWLDPFHFQGSEIAETHPSEELHNTLRVRLGSNNIFTLCFIEFAKLSAASSLI